MSVIITDSATSGIWDFKDKDPTSPRQPHVVRLAVLLIDSDGATIAETCHLIRPPRGEMIQEGAQRFHGITDKVCQDLGVSANGALTEFSHYLGVARLIVAHNWQYQQRLMDVSFARVGMPKRIWPDHFDTMVEAAPLVALERKAPSGGFLWPSFDQTCERFVGRVFGPSTDLIRDGILRVRAIKAFRDEILRKQPA